jgi:hypothetical protein
LEVMTEDEAISKFLSLRLQLAPQERPLGPQ